MVDTEIRPRNGIWAKDWSQIQEVFAVKVKNGIIVDRLFWDAKNITSQKSMLQEEWVAFSWQVSVIWSYALNGIDRQRLMLLFDGKYIDWHVWKDAYTLIAKDVFDALKSKTGAKLENKKLRRIGEWMDQDSSGQVLPLSLIQAPKPIGTLNKSIQDVKWLDRLVRFGQFITEKDHH